MKLSASCLVPVALLLVAGCTEILNIDVHYDDGGGGSGAGVPSNGGNGASVSDGGSGAGSSDGGSGGIMGTGGNGGAPTVCEAAPAGATCIADEFAGAAVGACWEPAFDPGAGTIPTTVDVSDGSLHLEPHTQSHGWWTIENQNPDRGYLLYRNIDGPFAVVTRAKATRPDTDQMPPEEDGSFRMAGLLMRDPVAFTATDEHWVKLEVGRRAANLTNGGGAVHPLGVLAGISKDEKVAGNVARHFHPYTDDPHYEAWLGMCRSGTNFFTMYRYGATTGPFVRQDDENNKMAQVTFPSLVQVGVTPAAYVGNPLMEAHFENVRFLEGSTLTFGSPEDCGAVLQQLADCPEDLACAACE